MEYISRGMPFEEAASINMTKDKHFIQVDEKKRNPNGNEKLFKPVSSVSFEYWFNN